jgi:hypothetical protein
MLGFKRLTADNWTDPDPVNRHFARIGPIAGPISMEGGDWAREFLAVSVADHVPEEVADPQADRDFANELRGIRPALRIAAHRRRGMGSCERGRGSAHRGNRACTRSRIVGSTADGGGRASARTNRSRLPSRRDGDRGPFE